MKAKILCGITAVLLGFALLHFARNMEKAVAADQMYSVEMREKIRNATVQIKMEIPHPDKNITGAMLRAKGLGSLIQWGEETLLVTHNHWGEFLQDTTSIEFRDAGNQLLKVISGVEFKSLIRYQDAGSLVLKAPDGIGLPPAPAFLEDASGLQAGEVVFLAYRQTPDLKNVAIIEATVEKVSTFQGLPAYTLRSLNGEPIKGGDSGGGVWHDGQLVGNLWATVELKDDPLIAILTGDAEQTTLKASNKSYAAIFPAIAQYTQPVAGSASGVRSDTSASSHYRNTIGVE